MRCTSIPVLCTILFLGAILTACTGKGGGHIRSYDSDNFAIDMSSGDVLILPKPPAIDDAPEGTRTTTSYRTYNGIVSATLLPLSNSGSDNATIIHVLSEVAPVIGTDRAFEEFQSRSGVGSNFLCKPTQSYMKELRVSAPKKTFLSVCGRNKSNVGNVNASFAIRGENSFVRVMLSWQSQPFEVLKRASWPVSLKEIEAAVSYYRRANFIE